MLNANMASIPLARQLSYIRNTISMGKLMAFVSDCTSESEAQLTDS